MKEILLIATALIGLLLAVVRLAECLYQLKKTPELDTIGEIWQVIKNFFTIERYKV